MARWLAALFGAWLLAGLVACQGGSNAHGSDSRSDSHTYRSNGPVQLPIQGFNYTDRTISSFHVDGTWGGNLFVSRRGAGGGKSACCVDWYDLLHRELPKPYTIRWISDMCRYQVEEGGGVFDRYRSLWQEEIVLLTDLPAEQPEAFQVHFFPDGRVEVAMAKAWEKPRLDLPYDPTTGRRPGVPDWPQCTDEQMKTYSE